MHVLVQLFLILVTVVVVSVLGLVIYNTIQQILTGASSKLAERNVNLSSKGATIGVKKRDREDYMDSTQAVLVDAWEKSKTTGYKSWLWSKGETKEKSRK